MRVISGNFRGLKLVAPTGDNTRPTLDRVREAIFSMLMPIIPDAACLDLFAGSGAMGIEALSRGADSACFVDLSTEAIDCVNANLKKIKLTDKTQVIRSDYCDFLKNCHNQFDIIFLDPPYDGNMYERCLELIHNNNLLKPSGIIVAEWDYELGFDVTTNHFDVVKNKKYGRVGVSVLKRSEPV